MFTAFLNQELRSAFTSPMLYIFLFIVTLLSFGAVASDTVSIGGAVGNVYKNAPQILTTFTLILGIFGLLFAAAFFNNAALRDHNNQFNEILFHLPISKAGYFWGRFIGALILSTIPMLGVFIGAWLGALIGPLAGWVEADRIGPFFFETIYTNYFIFVLPNMFVAGSIIFFLAHRSKSTIISFVGAMAIIVTYIISGTLLSDIDNESTAALADIFGIRTYSVETRYFTPAERNTLSPSFTGLVLQNRFIWIGVALLISFLSYRSFSFKEKLRFKKAKKEKPTPVTAAPTAWPQAHQTFGASLVWTQFRSIFRMNTLSITKSVVFKILALFGIILLVTSLAQGYEYFGLQSYPVTYMILDDITGSTSTFMIIIIVFFSGELVWRDRISRIDEVINSTPHGTAVSLFAKWASLIFVASLLHFSFVVLGICAQLFRGYTAIDFDLYLVDFLLGTLPNYVVYSALFVLIQTLVNNRYLGYFLGIIINFALAIIIGVFHWSSSMLVPGESPGIFFSDMSGFGPGVIATLWFDLYWVLFGLLLMCLAALFMERGISARLKDKLSAARQNFKGSLRIATLALTFAWIGVAAFVYYNTQILNPYKNNKQQELAQVAYEETYKKYAALPHPSLTDISYEIDIFPEKRDVYVRAKGQLLNKTDKGIDSLFFNIQSGWDTEIDISGAVLALNDTILDVRIYKLGKTLNPNESLEIRMVTSYLTKGFSNGLGNTDILSNGTFLNNFSILPIMAYSEQGEMSDRNDRKKYGLPMKLRMPELKHDCSEVCMSNYLTDGLADWVTVRSVISTSNDQIAVAPGSLVKQWEKDGRAYFQYELDKPSQNFYNFMSARYEVAREKYNDIDVEIYYDAKHGVNVPKMLDAVKRSLAYYEKHFGPYYHKQARILEFPRYSTFAQAFPGTMPYSEGFGFIVNLEDETEINVVDAVIAHEMAHQWWAHQEIPALMQGATMLTESFAEYSSLMVMKEGSDDMKMKQFLKYDFDRYLRGRTQEAEKELPLYKVENQQYIHYGKGSVILYALQDYIGVDSMNAALRSFLEATAYAEPPYPTSLEFLNHLEPRVPDSLKYLVRDWIKEITLYDLRLTDAKVEKRSDGKYAVSFEMDNRKLYADTLGNEKETPLNDWVDIGLYADSQEEKLLAWKRVKIQSGKSTEIMVVDTIPAKAAIDPRRMLVERVIKDNVKTVSLN